MVDEPVDHRGGDDVVAEDLAPGAEGLVAGDDHRGAFVAVGDEAEHQVGGFGVERDVADLVDDEQRDERQARSSASRLPWRLASERRATHWVAVANCTRWPARHARIESAIARWVLPVPGGPSRITFSRACRKSSCPRCSITVFLTERWKVKSNSSSVLRAGKRAALIRPSPPWLSRAETSVPSRISANRS